MKPHLTYFDIRGRAEVIRLILEDTATPYEERRVQLPEWPALKATMPFGQLPLYVEGNVQIPQSQAIYRYLARKHKLYGASEAEHIRVDVICEAAAETIASLSALFWDPQFASKRENYENTTLPDLLAKLERQLVQNNGGDGYWVGNGVTLADFTAWHALDYARALSLPTLQRFRKLDDFRLRFAARPRIAAYLQSPRRAKTITVPMAQYGGTPETS